MTLILNILRRDMSILAADRKAVASWPNSTAAGFPLSSAGLADRDDFNKIHFNATRTVALGIAGDVHDHSYTQVIAECGSINESLRIVRNHMERFLCVDDRANLSRLSPFTVNQSIASFFDPTTDTFYSNTFLFSRKRSETHLHRAGIESKLFCAGTGSEHYRVATAGESIDALFSPAADAVPGAFLQWIREAYRRVSTKDKGTGAEPTLMVSTKLAPEFRLVESGG